MCVCVTDSFREGICTLIQPELFVYIPIQRTISPFLFPVLVFCGPCGARLQTLGGAFAKSRTAAIVPLLHVAVEPTFASFPSLLACIMLLNASPLVLRISRRGAIKTWTVHTSNCRPRCTDVAWHVYRYIHSQNPDLPVSTHCLFVNPNCQEP